MITLKEIIERLDDGPDELAGHADGDDDGRFRPMTVEGIDVPPFSVPRSNANGASAKIKAALSKVLTFVRLAKEKRVKGANTVMPISGTSSENLWIWGSKMNVGRAIRLMERIGLLAEYDSTFRFNARTKGGNKAKRYVYFYENEAKLAEYCEANGIAAYDPPNASKAAIAVSFGANEELGFDLEDVVFSASLKLRKPSCMSMGGFEDFLTACLYHNYPGLRMWQGKVDEMNELHYKDYPEFAIRFRPRFTWDKKGSYVSKIGIRATNSFCNKKKGERPGILEKYGLRLAKDVTSSVPRVTLSLNQEHWVGEGLDVYRRISELMDPSAAFDQERRDQVKRIHMRVYFSETSDKDVGKNLWHDMRRAGAVKQDVDKVVAEYREALLEAEGGRTYGSEVFYAESMVYLMTLYDLLSSGHMAWMVYDAFYSTGDEDRVTFESMVNDGIRINFEDFYKNMWLARRGRR